MNVLLPVMYLILLLLLKSHNITDRTFSIFPFKDAPSWYYNTINVSLRAHNIALVFSSRKRIVLPIQINTPIIFIGRCVFLYNYSFQGGFCYETRKNQSDSRRPRKC